MFSLFLLLNPLVPLTNEKGSPEEAAKLISTLTTAGFSQTQSIKASQYVARKQREGREPKLISFIRVTPAGAIFSLAMKSRKGKKEERREEEQVLAELI